jgi:U3 small nucleolar RNA-associated protein 21
VWRLQLPAKITALACKGDLTFAAAGGRIVCTRRVHVVHSWQGHKGTVIQMLAMGDLLLSIGKDALLKLWNLDLSSQECMVRSARACERL